MMPAAGIVVSQAIPISPTIPQPTCRQRRRPTPIPTIDDRDDLGRADRRADDRGREDDAGAARLADQPVQAPEREDPPADRPDDRPAAEGGPEGQRQRAADDDPSGAERLVAWPLATSSAAMIPTAFWASFEPWLKASHAEATHWTPRTGPRNRTVARPIARRARRSRTRATTNPRQVARRSPTRTPKTPPSWPSWTGSPVDRVETGVEQRRADQAADQGVARARRDPPPPGEGVPDDRSGQAGADDRHGLLRRHGHDLGDRVGDGGADEQRAEEVEHRGHRDGRERPGDPRRDEGRDRVRRVVEAVRQGEREGHHDRQDERQVGRHPLTRVADPNALGRDARVGSRR